MNDRTRKIADSAVKAVFDSYPPDVRESLLNLRSLILETATTTDEAGQLQETLKWGQPSYLTLKPKSGSTIRIDQVKGEAGRYALYCHCQTTLIEDFRALYPDEFRFEGNRAMVFEATDKPDEDALRHCIALALTYHARKKGAASAK
ncbi:DUF1801 domain-containing protein [Denitrobaculum tricleocarpae]|uniref:DUF1801 domain-containing protein n=1 Tax=Denitrobaculum tricleocarpae TaxID=2591009 RepID=A0A545TKQ2_9PROT|nr:DUF1801 domain-containing protein [Denitrobaculum tricleocarpae]TQV77804.1 DUF1801 domain-containing protein [Denitrobaculum tricleocarpae]